MVPAKERYVKVCPECGSPSRLSQRTCLSCGASLDEATIGRQNIQWQREGWGWKARDKPRDDICASLWMLGIDARKAERGRPEETIVTYFHGGASLGLIDIAQGPIRWVNVVRHVEGGGEGIPPSTHIVWCCGVPDTRLVPNSSKLRMRSVRKKTFPLFGRVVDVHWKGTDLGWGIIGRLNSDLWLKEAIMGSRDVRIEAHDYGDWRETDVGTERICWIIHTDKDVAPSAELWNCCEAVARQLLAK